MDMPQLDERAALNCAVDTAQALLNAVPRTLNEAERLLHDLTWARTYVVRCVSLGERINKHDPSLARLRDALTPEPWCPESLEASD